MTVIFLFFIALVCIIYSKINNYNARKYNFIKTFKKIIKAATKINLLKVDTHIFIPETKQACDLISSNVGRIHDVIYSTVKESKSCRLEIDSKILNSIYSFCYDLIEQNFDFTNSRDFVNRIYKHFNNDDLSIYKLYAFPLIIRLAAIDKLRQCIDVLIQKQCKVHRLERLYTQCGPNAVREELLKDVEQVYYLSIKVDKYDSEFNEIIRHVALYSGISVDDICSKYRRENYNLSKELVSAINIILNVEIDLEELINELDNEKYFQNIDDGYRISNERTRKYYRYWLDRYCYESNQKERFVLDTIAEFKKVTNKSNGQGGYFLYGEGQKELNNELGCKFKTNQKIKETNKKLYFVSLFCFAVMFISLSLMFIGFKTLAPAVIFTIFYLPCFILIGKSLSDTLVARCFPQSFVPSINDVTINTNDVIVAIPCLIGSMEKCVRMIKKIEMCKLSNPNCTYALVCDFKMDDKKAVSGFVGYLSDQICKLNKKYIENFAFIARRNATVDGTSAPKERKRGALVELCNIAVGRDDKISYSCGIDHIKNKKYVFTIDEDTVISPGVVQKLFGDIKHPMNQINNCSHSMFQPLILPGIPYKPCTRFSKWYMCNQLMPTYPSIYCDEFSKIFDKTPFGGKGIFEASNYIKAYDKLPENKILSHDQPEGDILNCVTECSAICVEQVPQNPSDFFSREHRWIRGDWQNLLFLFGRKGFSAGFNFCCITNCINSLKDFAVCILVIIIALFFSEYFVDIIIVTGMVFSFEFIKCCIKNLCCLLNKTVNDKIKFIPTLRHCVLDVLLLPCKAAISIDAIVRSIFRSLVTKKNLLQWNCDIESKKHNAFAEYWAGPYWGMLILLFALFNKSNLLLSCIICAFYIISPIIYKFLSVELSSKNQPLDNKEKESLYVLAYKTLCYFIDGMVKSNNFLPPDNYQQEPYKGFCIRTSITNIGFGILSIACGVKMGLLPKEYAAELLGNTIDCVEHLNTYNNCHYNWYNVKTKEPLGGFISTVDSGNFVCCLLASAEILRSCDQKSNFDRETSQKLRILLTYLTADDKNANYKLLEELNVSGIKEFLYSFNDFERYPKAAKEIILSWKRSVFECAINLNGLADRIDKIVQSENLGYLFNEKKKLFYIGYDTITQNYTKGCYDLFASENLLTSYYAISRGIVTSDHWYALSRKRIILQGEAITLSWSGTMFETFMPLIFIDGGNDSLLSKSAEIVLRRNIEDTKITKLPFGVSESCSSSINSNGDYCYEAYGLEELALDTKCSQPIYSPYSSIMAFSNNPKSVFANIKNFTKRGMVDKYGLFESLDCRYAVPKIVGCYMAHHQGMILASLCNVLSNDAVRSAFMNHPESNSCKVILYQEPNAAERKKLKQNYNARNNDLERIDVAAARIKCGYASFDVTKFSFGIYFNDITIVPVAHYHHDKGGRLYFFNGERYVAVNWYSIQAGISNIICQGVVDEAYIKCEILSTLNDGTFVVSFDFSGKIPCNAKLAMGADLFMENSNRYYAHPQYCNLFIRNKLYSDGALVYISRYNNQLSCSIGISCNSAAEYYTSVENFRDRNIIYSIDPRTKNQYDCAVEPLLGFETDINLNKQIYITISVAHSSDQVKQCLNKHYDDIDELRLMSEEIAREFVANHNMSLADQAMYLRLAQPLIIGTERLGNTNFKKDLLYQYGISGDNKIVVVKMVDDNSAEVFNLLKSIAIFTNEVTDILVICNNAVVSDDVSSIINSYKTKLIKNIVLLHGDADIYNSIAHAVVNSDYSFKLRELLPLKVKICGAFDRSYIQSPQGFDNDGFYITEHTPKPWSNVLANGTFGAVVSENGTSSIFGDNAAICKYAHTESDAVRNIPTEVIYIRNQHGDIWTITGSPIDRGDDHVTLHSFGFSKFYYAGFGIDAEQTVFVDKSHNVKCCGINLYNTTDQEQFLTIGYYINAFIGENYNKDARFCRYEASGEYSLCVRDDKKLYLFGGDRYGVCSRAFLGKDYNLITPQLSVEYDGTPDCLCCIKEVCIMPGEQIKIWFYLSDALRNDFNADIALEYTKEWYQYFIDTVTITTENKSFNSFFSNWLPYQVLNSRFLARSGYYQSGGAYGFRDQLQDCLCLMYYDQSLVAKHIISCCEHQFEYGDVQHWWHSDVLGVRTRISDDRLWLPYVVCKYIEFSSDRSILDVETCYLVGNEPTEQVLYDTFNKTSYKQSIYQHCKKAIEISMTLGKNNLPLIGQGDWNDAMDQVGDEGKGESVWLGWFIMSIADMFIVYAKERNDEIFVKQLAKYCSALKKSLEEFAWRGDRYIRAITDDGIELGDRNSEICKIDAITQAWAVISGMCDIDKGRICVINAYDSLYDKNKNILKLFSPSFTESSVRAGYINDYPQGIRENGGQYTHGAVWLAKALAMCGYSDEAWNVLKCCAPVFKNRNQLELFKNEPYVISADIYSDGRGGWSWYTGAAGWFFTVVIQDIFGIKIAEDMLRIEPCLPFEIRKAEINIRIRKSNYKICYCNQFSHNVGGCKIYHNGRIIVDGLPLNGDELDHKIKVIV